jgi:hypothetical protein
VCPENLIPVDDVMESPKLAEWSGCFVSFWPSCPRSPFKSKLRLEAENALLRHQLIVLKRRLHGRVRLTNHDRWFFIQLYRWFPSILKVLTIIRPETLRTRIRRYLYPGCSPRLQGYRSRETIM